MEKEIKAVEESRINIVFKKICNEIPQNGEKEKKVFLIKNIVWFLKFSYKFMKWNSDLITYRIH